jgi:hypothetical protein
MLLVHATAVAVLTAVGPRAVLLEGLPVRANPIWPCD